MKAPIWVSTCAATIAATKPRLPGETLRILDHRLGATRLLSDNPRNIGLGQWTTPQTVQALAALAHETRLALYRMLVERGPDGLPAGVIAEQLACRRPR